MPKRYTPMRYMPMRYIPREMHTHKRYGPMRCMPMRYTPREMRAHEAHAHEAYCPETDEHCAVFAIRRLLPHEHLLSPTRTCCLPRVPCFLLREHAAYTHLLDFATCPKKYLHS